MKKIIIFALCAVLLALPFFSASAGFAEDMAWFRNMYDQVPNMFDDIPNYSYDDFYNDCDRFHSAFLNATSSEYEYYLIVPSVFYSYGSSQPYRLRFFVFASHEDSFTFSLVHRLELNSETLILDSMPDFSQYNFYRYSYCLSPVSLPSGSYVALLETDAKGRISSFDLTNSYSYYLSNPSYFSIPFLFQQENWNMQTDILLSSTIPSIDVLSSSVYSTASVLYQSQGEATDSAVDDFFRSSRFR